MQGNKVRNHDFKRFFSVCAVAFFILTIAMVETAAAKSVYLSADHHTRQFDAWNINPGPAPPLGTVTYQATYNLNYATDPAGIAIDAMTGLGNDPIMFVSTEGRGGIEVINPVTLKYHGVASGPVNMGGLDVDDVNNILFAIQRGTGAWGGSGTSNLYIYTYNDDGSGITKLANYTIPNHGYGMSLAFDDFRDVLWIGDTQYSMVKAYKKDNPAWTSIHEEPSLSFNVSHQLVDVAVDRKRNIVYTGGAWLGSYLLTKYDVSAGIESTVNTGFGVMGVAVDETTGYVYLTRGGTSGSGGGDMQVWDCSTSPFTLLQDTSDIGNPAGIAIGNVSYNPLNLAKNDTIQGYGVYIGDTFTYKITYDNMGNAFSVTNVRAIDTLPVELDYVSSTPAGGYDPGTHTVIWNLGTLTAGSPGGQILLDVRVNQNAVGGTTIYNYCTIESNQTPPTTVEGTDPDNPDPDEPGTYIIPNQPPIADANGPYVGNEGSPVTFDASGSSDPDGDPLQYRWDFNNDGTWDTGWSINPIASYTWNDDYSGTAKLEVNDGELTDTDTASVTVNNVAPTANADGPYTGSEGSTITFTGSATDPGSDTFEYRWDFDNDGTYDTPWSLDPSASYTWNDDHNGTVVLQVRDDDGELDTDTANVTVLNVAPTVDAGADQTVNEGAIVSLDPATFSDQGTEDTHTATIDWGDGSPLEDGTVNQPAGTVSGSHVYADNGVYMVTVTVTDDDGASTSDMLTVTVNNVAPTTDAGADQTANEGAVVSLAPATFNDKGTLDTHAATIDWGDGIVEPGAVSESPFGPPGSTAGVDGTVSGSHVYADNGVYMVTVTVKDDDGDSTSDSFTVTVLNVAPTVDAGPDQEVNEGDLVSLAPATFNDKGTLDTHTATIDWGDETPVEAGEVTESPFGPPGDTAGADGEVSGSHVYADNGIYTVTLTVEDDDGASTTVTTTVTVNNVAPTVDAGADQVVNEGDLASLAPATFNDKGTLDTHVATINWGDGSPVEVGAVSESPFGPPGDTAGANGTVAGSHVYGDNGVYTVTVTVEDDDGGIGSDALQITVLNVTPTVEAGDDQEITAGDYAEFEGTYSDPGWLDTHTAVWEFGDESTGDGVVTSDPLDPPNPVTGTVTGGHSYFKAGEFTVTLKVTDDDGDTGSDTLKVTVKSITATIDFDPDTLNKKGGDKWVTVYIELPEGYDVWQIDGSTVLLNGVVPAYLGKEGWAKAESNEANIMDHNDNGILERMVKFDRNAVKELLEVGDEVQVTVTGGVEYDNGHDTGLADFKGQDVIRVIEPGEGPKAAPALVKGFSFATLPAYPQPCNPEAWIPYELGKDVEVTITIYSSSGRIIRTLKLGHQEAGAYISKSKAAYWDGRNDVGEKVSSGVYFYAMEAGAFRTVKKMVIQR